MTFVLSFYNHNFFSGHIFPGSSAIILLEPYIKKESKVIQQFELNSYPPVIHLSLLKVYLIFMTPHFYKWDFLFLQQVGWNPTCWGHS